MAFRSAREARWILNGVDRCTSQLGWNHGQAACIGDRHRRLDGATSACRLYLAGDDWRLLGTHNAVDAGASFDLGRQLDAIRAGTTRRCRQASSISLSKTKRVTTRRPSTCSEESARRISLQNKRSVQPCSSESWHTSGSVSATRQARPTSLVGLGNQRRHCNLGTRAAGQLPKRFLPRSNVLLPRATSCTWALGLAFNLRTWQAFERKS